MHPVYRRSFLRLGVCAAALLAMDGHPLIRSTPAKPEPKPACPPLRQGEPTTWPAGYTPPPLGRQEWFNPTLPREYVARVAAKSLGKTAMVRDHLLHRAGL